MYHRWYLKILSEGGVLDWNSEGMGRGGWGRKGSVVWNSLIMGEFQL